MAEKIHTTSIEFEVGYLYFVKRDEHNRLCMWKAPLARGGRIKKDGTKTA